MTHTIHAIYWSCRLLQSYFRHQPASQNAIMATATDLAISSLTSLLSITSLPKADDVESTSPPANSIEGQDGNRSLSSDSSNTQSAEYWASLLRRAFNALGNGGTLDTECLKAPRRRHAGTYHLDNGHDGVIRPCSLPRFGFLQGHTDL